MYKLPDIIKKETPWQEKNRIIYILNEPFHSNCAAFLQSYHKNNPAKKLIEDYAVLPYVHNYPKNPEWFFRVQSLDVIKLHIKKNVPQTVLEIGSWNGWLTHHIAPLCNCYITADIFDDEVNGLSSIAHYKNATWLPVHGDIEKIDFFSIKFDLIIYNHCLQFFADLESALNNAKSVLQPNGQIFILGMNIYEHPERKKQDVAQYKAQYYQRTGTDLLFNNTKAYFDKEDKRTLDSMGFRIKNYPNYFTNNILRHIMHARPQVCYAVYENAG